MGCHDMSTLQACRKEVKFSVFFFFVLMEYGNSPYVHSENNKINGRNSHGKILTLESSGTLS